MPNQSMAKWAGHKRPSPKGKANTLAGRLGPFAGRPFLSVSNWPVPCLSSQTVSFILSPFVTHHKCLSSDPSVFHLPSPTLADSLLPLFFAQPSPFARIVSLPLPLYFSCLEGIIANSFFRPSFLYQWLDDFFFHFSCFFLFFKITTKHWQELVSEKRIWDK